VNLKTQKRKKERGLRCGQKPNLGRKKKDDSPAKYSNKLKVKNGVSSENSLQKKEKKKRRREITNKRE